MRKDKKEDEDGGSGGSSNPFSNLEKTSVLQEARVFNETPVNPRKCGTILAKILYMINKGEVLGTREATECFFAITKLFQSKDPVLRRMVYLGIKYLAPIAEDVIIVTSSLTKDMTGKEDAYRASAIRALCAITDPAMLQAIERYMKQGKHLSLIKPFKFPNCIHFSHCRSKFGHFISGSGFKLAYGNERRCQ